MSSILGDTVALHVMCPLPAAPVPSSTEEKEEVGVPAPPAKPDQRTEAETGCWSARQGVRQRVERI
eukprot:7576670-Prorocentrum_lima.AAC.1